MSTKKLFTSPVRKAFMKDLQHVANNTLIWVQGFITEIDKTEGTLIINDGTAGVEVRSLASVPGDVTWVHCGKYCMLIGHVQRTSYLFIEAIKLSDLASNTILQRMWETEVKDINHFVYHEMHN